MQNAPELKTIFIVYYHDPGHRPEQITFVVAHYVKYTPSLFYRHILMRWICWYEHHHICLSSVKA
eukprot:scaffold309958_cov21-Prasinocladus_malaysianus.AAC.1